MTRVDVEVFEALRSVMPEENAIRIAAALYEAIARAQHQSTGEHREAEPTGSRSAMATRFAPVRPKIAWADSGTRVLIFVMAANVICAMVIFVKVFFG